MAVGNRVAEGHRAVEIGGRRDRERAIAIVRHRRAVAGCDIRHCQSVAVDIREPSDQVRGADGVSRIFRAVSKGCGCGSCRGIVDGCDADGLRRRLRTAFPVDDIVVQRQRAVEIGRKRDRKGCLLYTSPSPRDS